MTWAAHDDSVQAELIGLRAITKSKVLLPFIPFFHLLTFLVYCPFSSVFNPACCTTFHGTLQHMLTV